MLNRFLYSNSHKNDNISSKKIETLHKRVFLLVIYYFLYRPTSLGICGTMGKTAAIMFRRTEKKALLFFVVIVRSMTFNS